MSAYVYDPCENRQWGPFEDEYDAEDFIASDKYLQSWCMVFPDGPDLTRNAAVYPPSEYHGIWPM